MSGPLLELFWRGSGKYPWIALSAIIPVLIGLPGVAEKLELPYEDTLIVAVKAVAEHLQWLIAALILFYLARLMWMVRSLT